MTKLLAILGVRPQEWPRVRWLMLHSVAFGFSKVTVISAGNTLFVSAFGAAAFPFIYMAAAVVVPVLGLALGRLEKRLAFNRYLVFILGTLLVLTIGLRLALAITTGRWLIVAAALLVEVVWAFGAIEFWSLVARLFDVREAKRLTGLVGAGEVLAIAGGGLLIPTLVSLVGTVNLLLFTAAAIAVSLLALSAIARSFPERLRGADEAAGGEEPAAASTSGPYLRVIYTISVFLVFAYYFADNMFYQRLEARFDDPDAIAGFVGILFGVASFFTFGARMVAGRLMMKLGLGFGLMTQPLLMGSAALALVAFGTFGGPGAAAVVFWIVMVIKVLERVTLDGFTRGAGMVMLQPLPAAERPRVHAFRLGVVEAVAGGLAGATLWLLISYLGLGAAPVGGVLLVLMLAWLAVNTVARSAYLKALTGALAKRILGGGELTIDRASLELIEGKLASPHAGEVLYTVELVAEHEPERLPELISPLLGHAAPEVRRRALEVIGEREIADAAGEVRALAAGDPEPAVRGDAVRALVALGEDEVFDEVTPHLRGSEPELQRGALVGLFRSGAIEAIMAAGERFLELQRSADPGERAFAARVIGEVGLDSFYRPLVKLVDDPEIEVRRAALLACRHLANPRLWPHVIENLTRSEGSPEAVVALAGAGESALPEIERVFERPDLGPEVQVHLVRAAGRIAAPGDRGAAGEVFLWRRHDHPDPEVRHSVLAALASSGFRADGRRGEVTAAIRREIAAAAEANGLLAAGLAGDGELLAAAIRHDAERCGDRVLLLLSSIYPAESVSRVRASLALGGEQQAYAVELLDNLLESGLKDGVLPLFEPLEPAERRARLAAALADGAPPSRPDLGALAAGECPWASAWTRTCTENARSAAAAAAGGETYRHPPTLARVLLLRQVEIFAGTPDQHLVAVAAVASELELAAGETFIREGEEGSSMYVVVEGRVKAHSGDYTFTELGPGTSLGELAALDSEKRSASATTIEPTRLLRIEQGALRQILAERQEVTRGVLRVLVGRLRRLG